MRHKERKGEVLARVRQDRRKRFRTAEPARRPAVSGPGTGHVGSTIAVVHLPSCCVATVSWQQRPRAGPGRGSGQGRWMGGCGGAGRYLSPVEYKNATDSAWNGFNGSPAMPQTRLKTTMPCTSRSSTGPASTVPLLARRRAFSNRTDRRSPTSRHHVRHAGAVRTKPTCSARDASRCPRTSSTPSHPRSKRSRTLRVASASGRATGTWRHADS